MAGKISLALVLNGSIPDVLDIKPQLENLIASKGLRLIFLKTASRRLYILEDNSYNDNNGGGQG